MNLFNTPSSVFTTEDVLMDEPRAGNKSTYRLPKSSQGLRVPLPALQIPISIKSQI